MVTKICPRCKQELPATTEFFSKRPRAKLGLRSECKECGKLERKKYSQEGYRCPSHSYEYNRNSKLVKYYGITLDDYNTLFENQNGVCAICGNPEDHTIKGKVSSLAVDHNHETGGVRGLLCCSCNQAIGKFKEDIKVMKNAIVYLESSRKSL